MLTLMKYRIHEYNTTCLVLTLLPLHTRPLFRALLSIVPRTLNPTLAFLRPYVQSEELPPRHTIVYAATHNDPFFTAWSRHVVCSCRIGHPSSASICYWATGAAETITARLDQAMAGRREVQSEEEGNLLRQILPVLSDGLAMRAIPEMRTACFTIVSVLAARIELETRASVAFMEAIVRGQAGSPSSTEMLCLALVARSSKLPRLPKPVFQAITAGQTISSLGSALEKARERCEVGDLTLGILTGYKDRLKSANKGNCANFLKVAIDADLLIGSQIAAAIEVVFRPQKDEDMNHFESEIQQFLSELKFSAASERKVVEALETLHINAHFPSSNTVPLLENADSPTEQSQHSNAPVEIKQPNLLNLSEMNASAPGGSYASLFAAPREFFQALAFHIFANSGPSYTLEGFASLGIFAGKDVQLEVSFVTLFSRVLVGNFSTHQKVAALGAMCQLLSRAGMSFDVQIVIPYVLCALCDPAYRVRDAASHFVVALGEYYSGLKKRAEHLGDVKILGEADMHWGTGGDLTPTWLEIKDVQSLQSDVLMPHLEECRQDMRFLPKVVGSALSKSKHNDNGQRLKKSTRARVMSTLYHSALTSPSYLFTLRLLGMIKMVQPGKAKSRSQELRPLFAELERTSDTELRKICVRDGVQADELLSELANVITSRDQHGIQVLLDLIVHGGSSRNTLLRTAGLRRVILLWPSLSEEARASFAISFFNMATGSAVEDSDHQNEVVLALRELDLSAHILVTLLGQAPKLMSNEEDPPLSTKRRKTNGGLATQSSGNRATQSSSLHKLTMLIELVESAEARKDAILVQQLFDILEDLQHSKHQTGLECAYLQSVLLDSIRTEIDQLRIPRKSKTGEILQAAQVDLVVDTLRTSGVNVQNSALALLSSMAQVAPGTIIHSVMPIFTLMGSTTLAQSDENSIHVVTQTISSVIPPLVAEFETRKEGPWTAVSELVTGFVTAIEHIPAAERLRVFSVLVDTLGSDKFMFILVALALITHSGDKSVAELLKNLVLDQTSATQVTVSTVQFQCMKLTKAKDCCEMHPNDGPTRLWRLPRDKLAERA